jgi:hypothetical protein
VAEEHLKGAELVGSHGSGYRIPKILAGLKLLVGSSGAAAGVRSSRFLACPKPLPEKVVKGLVLPGGN